MPEQSAVPQSLESSSPPATPISNELGAKASEANKATASVVAWCSLGMIGYFFLPWIQFLFGEISGYRIQQLPGEEVKFVWFTLHFLKKAKQA